jgi:hypothetical protein
MTGDDIRSRWRRLLPLAAPLLVLAVCTSCGDPSAGFADAAIPVFTSAGQELARHDSQAPSTIRYRTVRLNQLVMTPGAVGVGDRLFVAGFAGRSFVAVVDRTNRDSNDVFSIRARIAGTAPGYLLLSLDGERVLGSLAALEQGIRWRIAPGPEPGVHVLEDVDPRLEAPVGEWCAPQPDPSLSATAFDAPSQSAESVAPADGRTTPVDVMVVYSAAAWRAWEGSAGGIRAGMALALEEGQLALDNSRIDMRLRIVHAAMVNFGGSDCLSDLYEVMRAGEVREWRDLYGADLVTFVSTARDYDGMAWLLQRRGGSPSAGFSVVTYLRGFTFIHELGHNLGAHHRRDQRDQPGPGIFWYSAGWRWRGSDARRYCSVMSYQDSWNDKSVDRAPYFSSPLVEYQGAPTGNANNDNARTLRETMGWVSGYRPTRVFLYPPRNARGEKILNRSLSQAEYINVLRWEANPDNKNVDEYRIYLVEDGKRTKIATKTPGELEHQHRGVEATRQYIYQIVAVREGVLESNPAYVTLN